MIIDERLSVFIDALQWNLPGELAELEQQALEDQVPIIRRPMQTFPAPPPRLTPPAPPLESGPPKQISYVMARKTGSACWREMRQRYLKSFVYKEINMILFLWMLPRDSILIFCRIY